MVILRTGSLPDLGGFLHGCAKVDETNTAFVDNLADRNLSPIAACKAWVDWSAVLRVVDQLLNSRLGE
jgi:hypothetical protein